MGDTLNGEIIKPNRIAYPRTSYKRCAGIFCEKLAKLAAMQT